MNVGVVVIDTLRYDTLNSEMERLRRRADHTYERMYSTSRWTVPAHASLFTGQYPTEVGTHSRNLQLTESIPTTAEYAREAGFDTHLFSNNVYIDSFFGFDRGFDSLVRGPNLRGRPADSSGFDWTTLFNELGSGLSRYPKTLARIVRSDAPTVSTIREGISMMLSSGGQSEESIDWFLDPFKSDIAGSRGDTFLTVNLMTCHSPYVPPDEYRTVEPYTVDPFELTLRSDPVTDREHRRHVESYEACARYLDDALQTVIDIVDWDALFIVGDHGELFGEHGLRQHQYGVYEELIHVPTLAFGSEIPAGTTETLTSLVDIHATLLDLMDLSDAETGRGESLLSGDPIRDHVYAESVGNYRATPGASGFDEKIPRSWSDPHYMYATDDALFVSDKDGERVISTDWKEERPEYRDELQQAVAQLRSELPTTTSGATNRNVPESIESRLASLGYR